MAMNPNIIFVGVGVLAAVALFMVQSNGAAAGPRPRDRSTGTGQGTTPRPVDPGGRGIPPVEKLATGFGRPTTHISVLGRPEVKAIATQ